MQFTVKRGKQEGNDNLKQKAEWLTMILFNGISNFVDYFMQGHPTAMTLYPIYPTPPLGQYMTQGQFLSGV